MKDVGGEAPASQYEAGLEQREVEAATVIRHHAVELAQ